MTKRILATGIIADAPTPNLNVYPREVLERVVREFNVRAKRTKVKGGEMNAVIYEIGEPTHIVKRLFINDSDMLCAEIDILDTEAGNILLEKLNGSSHAIARPIMCVPNYVHDGKSAEKSDPLEITQINSIVRVQVECNGSKEDNQ